jgi:hypothetical protein
MQIALASEKDFTGRPAPMVPFADWDYYYTNGVIEWEPSTKSPQGLAVTIPIGFVTDLASIPRVFWSLLSPHARYTYPAIVHDYLYWKQPCDRDTADRVLRLAMEDVGVGEATAVTIYEAVHIGGASAWSSNAKAKVNGESRFLKRFPDSVRITWKEWKSDPNNFER